MPDTRDIAATTNPAYCSLVIHMFVEAYTEAAAVPPPLPLCFLPVPCVLSTEVAVKFEGTNSTTGLLEWVARHPELQIELPEEVAETRDISRTALLFGLSQGIFTVRDDATVAAAREQLKRVPKDRSGVEPCRRVFSLASRLGTWCGAVGRASIIFSVLGIRP